MSNTIKNKKILEDRLGKTKINNEGYLMRIIKYLNNEDIDVNFPELGITIESVAYSRFKNGALRHEVRKLHGVGYMGSGKYKSKNKNKQTKEYIVWKHMIARCYENEDTRSKKNMSYTDCTVCKEWHNFQNFAKWHTENNLIVEEKLRLDKDIVKSNNKIYSPETCVLIPESINIFFSHFQNHNRVLPIGVTIPHKNTPNYRASMSKWGTQKHIGCYSTPEEASIAYKKEKRIYAIELAMKYKDILDEKVYKKLTEFNLDNWLKKKVDYE